MPGTKAGSSNSDWTEHLNKCASEYHDKTKQDKPPRREPDRKEQSIASKTREVARGSAQTLSNPNPSIKQQRKLENAIPMPQKHTRKKQRNQSKEQFAKRLDNEVTHTAARMNDDAVARAHKTITARRNDTRKS